MRGKPISVKFPVPKIAAAKLRDLAISRDPRLLELGILAVQITEHEKIVVSFGKPPYGQIKPKAKNREAPKKTRVKTERNRPKNATPVSRPVTSHSISIPGIAAPLQNRNPVCHLNNNKVITNNAKGEQQAAKEKLRQAVYRRPDYPTTLTTLQSSAETTAVNSAFVSIDRNTARNASLSCSNIKVLSNSPPKRATDHQRLDNKSHGVLEQNCITSRSRAESEALVKTPTHTSPSASPSNESTLSSSSTPPLGEAQNRLRSSSSSSPEQASFSLMGLQETTYMGRQRALFDWVMNSEEKKFCASNRLRELAKVHGADVTSAKTSPGISAPKQTTTASNTSALLQGSTFKLSTTNTKSVTGPAACASTSTRTIPTPTPGIHRVKIPNRYSHGIAQAHQVSKAPFSVGGSLSERPTYVTTGQRDSLTLPTSSKASIDKVASGHLDGRSVEMSNSMNSISGQICPTTSSSSEQFWAHANQVNHIVESKSDINTIPYAGEVKKAKADSYNSSFVDTNNEKSAYKESRDIVSCLSDPMLSGSNISSNIPHQTDALSVTSKNLQVVKPGETKEPLTHSIGSSVGHVNVENTQYSAVPTVDANNNQMDVSKPLNVPLMYPYSTGMLSNPVAVGSEITASPGVAIGLQYATKPQATTIQQAYIPDQFAFATQTAPKLESAPNVQTVSFSTRTMTGQMASSPPFVVQPQFASNVSTVPITSQSVTMQPVNNHNKTGPCPAIDTSQAVASCWGITDSPISTVTNCATCAQVTTHSSTSSQVATAFVSTPQFLINPQNALSFQALTNSQGFKSLPVTGNLQSSADQQVTMSSTEVATKASNKLQGVASADFTPNQQMLINCQVFSPSQNVSCPQTAASPTLAQNSKLLLAAKENIQLHSGQQLNSVMRTIKTEDYNDSSQGAGEILLDETVESHENQALTAAPIQFIDLSGTLRYWQQWSLYYRNLIERQNAVAALLSMQNAIPPATTAATSELNLPAASEACNEASSSSSHSPGKEDQTILQKSNVGSLENHTIPCSQQDEKSSESLACNVLTGQESPSVGTLHDTTVQLRKHSNCELEKDVLNPEIQNIPQSSAEEICNNKNLSTEATIVSSRRKSVIVDSRANDLGSSISDKSDLKDVRCTEPDSGSSENSGAKAETSTIALSSVDNKPENETMKNVPELQKSSAEIILETECMLDVDVCDHETPSPSTHDSSDDSSGSLPMTRRLRSSRSNSNPPTPELSFIPESSIECVNVGGNKRGSSTTESALPAKRRRSKRSS